MTTDENILFRRVVLKRKDDDVALQPDENDLFRRFPMIKQPFHFNTMLEQSVFIFTKNILNAFTIH